MTLDTVLFDYGHTLVDFRRTQEALHTAYTQIREVVVAAVDSAHPVPHAHELITDVGDAIQRLVEASYRERRLEELDLLALFDEALRGIGYALPADVVRGIVELDHRAWSTSISLPASTAETLETLRSRGYRVGFVSNAHFLPDLLRADLDELGLASLLDGGAFSSEVGRRKPDPAIFGHVLDELGSTPQRAIMVGDRVSDDVSGAVAAGLRGAVLTHEYRAEDPDGQELAVVTDIREVAEVVERLSQRR